MKEVKRIIIVDDDPAILDAVQIMLELKGYEVLTFSNGGPLLRAAFELPLLFILDNQMPGVSGLDLCRHLKCREETQDIPVVIMSASPHIGKFAKEAGAEAFLEKPFTMLALREMVEGLTKVRAG